MFEHPFSIDFCWQSVDELNCTVKSTAALLFDQGSLTSLLKKQCEQFRVQVLSEKWLQASSEQRAVFNEYIDKVLCREVILYCDDVPIVYAQSWITEAAYQIGVSELGETPLGEVLFSDQSWLHSPLQVCEFDCRNTFIESLEPQIKGMRNLYARRRLFSKQEAQVMVCEVFLLGDGHAIECA